MVIIKIKPQGPAVLCAYQISKSLKSRLNYSTICKAEYLKKKN